MTTFLLVLLIIDSLVLMTVILLQSGKGGGLASSFGGASTFALLPTAQEAAAADRTAAVKVVGVPFDSGVSYRPGARFGPGHVRQSSRLLRPYNPATDTSPFAQAQVVDAGDMAVNPFNIHEAIEALSTES